MQPFLVPNICAYPSKNNAQVVCDIEKSRKIEETLQEEFDLELGSIIRDVEKDLRYKKCHMIDDKAKSQIRKKQVSYKVYHEDNCINFYLDTSKT